MFPFIWWLTDGQSGGAVPVDGGGEDFVRRRVIMSTSQKPRGGQPLGALAWYYASSEFVTLDANVTVTEWRDRGPYGFHLTSAVEEERPAWEQIGGWSAEKSSLLFSGAKNLATAGPLATRFNGSDVPLWAVATIRLTTLTQDRTVLAWDNLTAECEMGLQDTTGFSLFTRTDDAAGSVTATATSGGATSGTHRRVGWSFAGTTVSSWIDATQTLDNAACNVGACTFNRLRLGEGLGIADTFVGRMVEVVIGAGVLTNADWLKYYNYSLGEWA